VRRALSSKTRTTCSYFFVFFFHQEFFELKRRDVAERRVKALGNVEGFNVNRRKTKEAFTIIIKGDYYHPLVHTNKAEIGENRTETGLAARLSQNGCNKSLISSELVEPFSGGSLFEPVK
jgi:hypothetical protein